MSYTTQKETTISMRENGMQDPHRIVFLEDNPDDVELILHELSEAGMNVESTRIDRKRDFIQTAVDFQPDIILADYSLSSFNGVQAFRMLRQEKLDIPFILVTGVLSEEMALQCLKEGIDDFVLKSNFKRLPQAIANAIEKRNNENEKARMAEELRKSHKELGFLLNRHQLSVEEERKNIARDLHDELGQVLTALKIDITMLWKKVSKSDLKVNSEFEDIISLVDGITRSVKNISAGLRPDTLDELGLVDAIGAHAVEFQRRTGIECRTFLPPHEPELDKDLSIALYRIVQEAMTNVARHSMATVTEISLEIDDRELHLNVKDNGKGISESELTSSHSLGIIGLRERVRLLDGSFGIGNIEGGGTFVSITMPLENKIQKL